MDVGTIFVCMVVYCACYFNSFLLGEGGFWVDMYVSADAMCPLFLKKKNVEGRTSLGGFFFLFFGSMSVGRSVSGLVCLPFLSMG